MFAAVLIARLRQRPASEWSVLVLGALLPVLVDPAAPLELGWQLSVLGAAALAASGIVRPLSTRSCTHQAPMPGLPLLLPLLPVSTEPCPTPPHGARAGHNWRY